jgi:hypothetical protein
MAFFCQQTGVRIAAPGVSKLVDPVNGQDEFSEAPSASPPAPEEPPAAHEGEPKTTNEAPSASPPSKRSGK